MSDSSTSKSIRALLPIALIAIFVTVVLRSDLRMSQTFDEGFHLVAGYRYLQCGDFGINAEHPPLVKMVAALPLVLSRTPQPAGGECGREETTKGHGYSLGVQYLYHQGLDAQRVLFKGRAATVIFAIALMTLVFFYAQELFGYWAAILAIVIAVCEPTIIAHAALVTTDMAASAGVLAAVFALDRFLQMRTAGRFVCAGLGVGLALAAKHSGLIVIPIIIALTIADLFLQDDPREQMRARALRSLGALAGIIAMGVVVLWATYGFRYWPRPEHTPMTMSLADFLTSVRAQGTTGLMPDYLIPFAARIHLLPLAYLTGLVDILNVSHPGLPPWILGRLLPHGVWYYFPVTFFIKSTPAFVLLLLISIFGGGWLKRERRRTAVFLLFPVAIWYSIAMTSGLDIGYRHVLPTVTFLVIFIAGGLAHLASQLERRVWIRLAAVLVLLHVASAVFAYPDYFAYCDELLGGKKKTYKYLTDSNNDWGQALYETAIWLKERNITDCWIAYDGAADLKYYGVPCRVLPGNPGDNPPMPPNEANGLFIISGLSYAGVEWEPDPLQPYYVFHGNKPSDNIGGAMLVFHGTYDLRKVQAVLYTIKSGNERDTDPVQALTDARAALAITPMSVRARLAEAHAYESLHQDTFARASFEAALSQADRLGQDWYPAQIAEAQEGLRKSDTNVAKQ